MWKFVTFVEICYLICIMLKNKQTLKSTQHYDTVYELLTKKMEIVTK